MKLHRPPALASVVLRNERKTVAVSTAPPEETRSSPTVLWRASATFGLLRNPRKTGTPRPLEATSFRHGGAARLVPFALCLLYALLATSHALYAQDPDLLAWGGPQSSPLEKFENHLAPTVGSPEHAVFKMLEVAKLKRGETLYDLGCGDGRILIAAAKRYHVNAVGIEISPELAQQAVDKSREAGLQNHIKVIHGDFMKTDLSAANVVTLYLATAANDTLRPNLERYLKPDTRVISYDYPIPGWKAIDTFDSDGHMGDIHVIYLYQVPASIVNKK